MIGLLGSLLGGRGGRMLGGMIGGRNGAMIGGLVGSLIGGRRLSRGLSRGGGLGGLTGGLGGLLGGDDDQSAATGQASGLADDGDAITEEDAALLIRAMANAAKSDGSVSREEVEGILGRLQDAEDGEVEFLNRELTSPFVPADQFAAGVPDDLAVETYVVSATAVEIDTNEENDYLRDLAAALKIDADSRDALHAELGIVAVE